MAVVKTATTLEEMAQDLAERASENLKGVILDLLRTGVDVGREPLLLECSLSGLRDSTGNSIDQIRVASIGLDARVSPPVISSSPIGHQTSLIGRKREPSPKRRKLTELGSEHARTFDQEVHNFVVTSQTGGDVGTAVRTELTPQHQIMQRSTLEKFLAGIWQSIYSGIKLDPTEIIEQWQAIESSGQPRLLTTERDSAFRRPSAAQTSFERMNVLTRKVSQASRTCRSLEVIVQAHWVQCFDDRVAELTLSLPREKAKKQTIVEACMGFSWSEKELRNKMGVWRGYHDIALSGGWAALVFAGMGLYRFCKYRSSFTAGTFDTLKARKHRFEVAADTLHPRWRHLLGIIGRPTERKYTGHPHDWVVAGPGDEALPLPKTYHQWDKDFSYTHLDEANIDADFWGASDPRTVSSPSSDGAYTCDTCGEHQSDDPTANYCSCFPNLYGSVKAVPAPVQIFRTPNGKNNGLIACCTVESGAAIGEFIGQITSGLADLDVMVGQTDSTTYQIWQGRQGNHTRFINHSCRPNSEYERFVWLGTQRIVLVSRGVRAEEEITVDYSDVYWRDLDKVCLCGHSQCRYNKRGGNLPVAPAPS
ncbi:hypothetical protein LTR91_012640 [Friedmanniomyces endolithicus]|uniref:SET domain-containing protein n=1 Tax=Friedmanniomyces endolithicus TaxID=329885 RepID=A0AAN6KEX5_9PEZI|nr:hypothetical protein LTR82_006867 [Friedmanniomyces endolithicus]KAK0975533.1 hypothetical protein LTS01_013839 [Friedmanniomyces endolithicus]KAK0979281.1 hypothetical protein LTR91_012640 [Friedmanniomyces endolithicus]KAK0982247.1 hypothetical protein LTR54_014768 [Friedmanniomyces endolithicus]KAK1042439.1 hypothetical protein LTS16_008842 [Friedmanniomyces endolithicus]